MELVFVISYSLFTFSIDMKTVILIQWLDLRIKIDFLYKEKKENLVKIPILLINLLGNSSQCTEDIQTCMSFHIGCFHHLQGICTGQEQPKEATPFQKKT